MSASDECVVDEECTIVITVKNQGINLWLVVLHDQNMMRYSRPAANGEVRLKG